MNHHIVAIAFVLGIILFACGDAKENQPPPDASRPAEATQAHDLSKPVALQVEGVGEIRLFLNPADGMITPWLLGKKVWEETETHWLANSIRPGDTVADIGANIGYYSVVAGRLVGEKGRVVAFEPDPIAASFIRRNVELNGLSNVTVEQKAVSNEPGSIRLFLSEENKGDHRIYQPEGEARPFVDVEAVTLDDYFAGTDPPSVVKVDTQGAELAIFRGMAGTVKDADDFVITVEYSPHHLAGFGGTGKQLLDEIDAFELEMFDLGGGGPGLQPLGRTSREALLERFTPDKKRFTNLLLVKGRPQLRAEIEAQLPPLR
ncbi:MAG: FkbM family methyltransferase [Myxococcota bacterium]|nr:FkbM family methyltransferase [Myxococcota bacterium]